MNENVLSTEDAKENSSEAGCSRRLLLLLLFPWLAHNWSREFSSDVGRGHMLELCPGTNACENGRRAWHGERQVKISEDQ